MPQANRNIKVGILRNLLDSECGILSENLLEATVLEKSPHFFSLFLQELQLAEDWVNAKGIPSPQHFPWS